MPRAITLQRADAGSTESADLLISSAQGQQLYRYGGDEQEIEELDQATGACDTGFGLVELR